MAWHEQNGKESKKQYALIFPSIAYRKSQMMLALGTYRFCQKVFIPYLLVHLIFRPVQAAKSIETLPCVLFALKYEKNIYLQLY